MKLLSRLSHTNYTEYHDGLGESFRNIVLKRTKYYANSYYRKSLCLKQDKQVIVGRWRPFGAPSRLNPVSSAFPLLQLYNPFTLASTRVRVVSNDLTVPLDDHRYENRVLTSEGHLKLKRQCSMHSISFPECSHIRSLPRRPDLDISRFSIPMSKTTSPYILLSVTNKRASRITVSSRSNSEFTS